MDCQRTFKALIVGADQFQEKMQSHLHNSPYTLFPAANNRQVIELVAQRFLIRIVAQFAMPVLAPFQPLDELATNGEGWAVVVMAVNPTTEDIVCLQGTAFNAIKYRQELQLRKFIPGRVLSSRKLQRNIPFFSAQLYCCNKTFQFACRMILITSTKPILGWRNCLFSQSGF